MSRGHIEQRSPGSWTIRVSGGTDDAGKRIRVAETVHGGRKDAEKILTRMLRDVDQGKVATSGAATLGRYLEDRWLPHMRSRVGVETWDRYESLVRVHVVPRIGRVRLSKLRPHHLQATLDSMLADGASPASVVKTHNVMKSSLKQAVRWQLLAASPSDGVSPPAARRPTLTVPAAEDMRRLIDAAAETGYAIAVLLAATTGARRGELLRVRWADLDLDAATLTILLGKTDRARRTIDVPASTVAALRAHRKAQNERRLLCGESWQDLGLVVDRGDGGPVNPDSLSHAFADIAESAGLPDVRLHDLRHGYATACLRAGVPLKIVAEALGHSRSSFTADTYQHVLPGMGKQAATAIEGRAGRMSDGPCGQSRGQSPLKRQDAPGRGGMQPTA
jgi:integrase